MDNLTELFCLMDDFCREFEPSFKMQSLLSTPKSRSRKPGLSLAEIMTLVVLFHQLRFRQFKSFYLFHALRYLREAFPTLPSYSRFVELMPRGQFALTILLNQMLGECSGISIVDSTPIAVCDNLRIGRHKTFKNMAQRGKSSTGWFYGFKLHAVINHLGEIIAVKLTSANTDDRQPVVDLMCDAFGTLYADKGYISKELTAKLEGMGIRLVTKTRRNMKPVEHSAFDKAVLKHRSLIETVFDEMKNLCQIEHTRHRSVANFIVNLVAGLVAYCLMPNKPKLPVHVSAVIPN